MKAKEPLIKNGLALWFCGRCETWKPAENYYSCKRSANGLKAQCRACHTEGSIRTRDADKSRSGNAAYMRRARKRDPEKFRKREREFGRLRLKNDRIEARVVLNNAIQAGKIMRPLACQRCLSKCKPHGHHTDYSKPLKVEWLCTTCHGKEHRK